MTRDELIENVGEAVVYDLSDRRGFRHLIDDLDAEVLADIRGTVGAAALAVIVEWLEGEATQANELINNPHRNQDFTTNIGLAATAREILRLIAMLKEPTT